MSKPLICILCSSHPNGGLTCCSCCCFCCCPCRLVAAPVYAARFSGPCLVKFLDPEESAHQAAAREAGTSQKECRPHDFQPSWHVPGAFLVGLLCAVVKLEQPPICNTQDRCCCCVTLYRQGSSESVLGSGELDYLF